MLVVAMNDLRNLITAVERAYLTRLIRQASTQRRESARAFKRMQLRSRRKVSP